MRLPATPSCRHIHSRTPGAGFHSCRRELFIRIQSISRSAETKREFLCARAPAHLLDRYRTPERYLQAHHDLLANRVGRIHIKERRGSFDAATVAEIDERSIIGDDCQIKPGARIINSVLGKGCFVEERAHVENSVIWPHTRIGTAAEVSNAIVGRGVTFGRSAVIDHDRFFGR